MFKLCAGAACFFAFCFLFCQHLHAHNGKVGYAYPLQKITIDGNLSDWPKGLVRYMLNTELSPLKSSGEADYNGFFQVGYNLAEHSLYLAFTITDDNFLEDTTANVKWDSQDGLELYLDARHLPTGSGVSFIYVQPETAEH
jgi:hypothetical protein